MSERKPSLNAGPRIRGNTYNTVNLGGRNTVISGPNYDANAGTEIIGDAFGVLNFNEQNDARGIEEFTQHQAGRAGRTESQSTESSFQINGYVKIFNQGFDRPGSERDVANLMETFRRRGVEPVVTLNSKYEEISSEIDSLSKFDFSTYKLFVCIVMSHGHTNGRLCAADREFTVEPTIVEPIMKNKSLNGIPKIFIIVACRGSERYIKCDTVKCTLKMDEMDREIDGLIDGHFSGAAGIVPYLISYSTLEGLVSYRTAEAGTFFIQSFCNNINKATGETDINSVFTNVNQELASEYQIQAPEFKTTMGNIRFKDLEAKPN